MSTPLVTFFKKQTFLFSFIFLFIGSLFLIIPSSASAATITVDTTNCTLIDALLSSNADSDTGTCTAGDGEVVGSYGDDTLLITTDIALTSAYSGVNGLPPITDTTTIQSDVAGTQRTISRSSASNFRIFSVSGVIVEFTDLVITNGKVAAFSGGGAGILIQSGSDVTLDNVTVSNNTSTGVVSTSGGGINLTTADLVITNSTITNNTSSAGGGIAQSGGTLEISNSEISNNTSLGTSGGSGLLLQQSGSGTASIENTLIENNVGKGAIVVLGITSTFNFTLEDSVVSGNSTSGEVYLSKSVSTIRNTTFTDNTASTNGLLNVPLSGIGIKNSTVTIEGATLANNSASGTNGSSGIYVVGDSHVEITNSTITENTAHTSAGIATNRGHASSGRTVEIFHTTVTDNDADFAGLTVRGEAGDDVSVEITNSIIAENTGSSAENCSINDYGSAGAANLTSHGGNIFGTMDADLGVVTSTCTSSLTTDDFYDVIDVGIDPLDDNGGPTETQALIAGSIAIDFGVSSSVNEDQRGEDRPMDGNGDSNALPDAGAYEFGESTQTIDTGCQSMSCTPQLLNFACKDPDADPLISAMFLAPNDPRFPFFVHNPAYCRYANFDFFIEPLSVALEQDILDEELPTTPPVPPLACPFFTDFVDETSPLSSTRRSQIALWQWFLKTYFEEPLNITGIYDLQTQAGIAHFQGYFGEVILRPWTWGPSKLVYRPTSRIYKLTQAVGNILLGCYPDKKVWVEDAQQEYDVVLGMDEHYPNFAGAALRALQSGTSTSLIPATPADFVPLRLRGNR